MTPQNEPNGFSYSYSAKEQAELKKIRAKYVSHEKDEREDKMALLRRLDAGATKSARIAALSAGVIGVLILGFGMSLAMSELSLILGDAAHLSVLIGAVIGTLGGILAGCAYPLYNAVLRHKRKKLAPQILRLTEELLK